MGTRIRQLLFFSVSASQVVIVHRVFWVLCDRRLEKGTGFRNISCQSVSHPSLAGGHTSPHQLVLILIVLELCQGLFKDGSRRLVHAVLIKDFRVEGYIIELRGVVGIKSIGTPDLLKIRVFGID